MTSTSCIGFAQGADADYRSQSGNWAFDEGLRTSTVPGLTAPSRTLPQMACLAFRLAVSSLTSGPDPWLDAQQQRSQLAVTSEFRTSPRHPITPLEARKIALAILRRAEVERAQVAQEEAARGINWEEMS